jgi:hypothetical protein
MGNVFQAGIELSDAPTSMLEQFHLYLGDELVTALKGWRRRPGRTADQGTREDDATS